MQGSEPSAVGGLPGYPTVARYDLLHEQGSVLCAALYQSLDKSIDCGSTLYDSTNVVTLGSSSYPLVDAARVGAVVPTGSAPIGLGIAFNQQFGSTPTTQPTAYQLTGVNDVFCTVSSDNMPATKTTQTTSRLLGTPMTTMREMVSVQMQFPSKLFPLMGTWDPKDPDHLSGRAVMQSLPNPLPGGVKQTGTFEWDLRRYQ